MTDPNEWLKRLITDALARTPEPANDTGEPEDPAIEPAAVSLMITRQQRARLRELGWTDDQIREMTPDEAHRHLAV
ncbi:hypothetical protein [Lichenihabitans psoromatis]|uniref:hypothetical protein n=1 Tax=Lichenihabitans psoromatis TaxID=2528642 RepID=UPI0010360211|nr:hypothetical protein [Lichenihabitans psoromatis]